MKLNANLEHNPARSKDRRVGKHNTTEYCLDIHCQIHNVENIGTFPHEAFVA